MVLKDCQSQEPGARQGCLFSSVLFSIVLDVLTSIVRKGKKVYRLERKKSDCLFADTNDLIIYGLPGGSVVKNLPAVLENKVQSLGWEDNLEKEEATHSGVKFHGQRSLAVHSPQGHKRIRHGLATQQQQIIIYVETPKEFWKSY